MSRVWLISLIGIASVTGILFAAYPLLDVQVVEWFFDHKTSNFPFAAAPQWNAVRSIASWIPVLFLAPACYALLRKFVYPTQRMVVAPSVVIFLLGSFVIGPGLTSNLLLKDNWGRPRPHQVQQFGGTQKFEPWWRPTGTCERNCSFVSGEASSAFWVVAPASLAPPQIRPVALGGAVLFGASVGALRMVFGRHFLTDVVFAALVTIVIIFVLRLLLLAPVRRNDARLEQALERASFTLHRGVRALLTRSHTALLQAALTLRKAGHSWREKVSNL